MDVHEATNQWADAMIARASKYTDWTAAWRNGMRNANKWASERSSKTTLATMRMGASNGDYGPPEGRVMPILIKSNTAASDKNRWGTQWSCFWDAEALYGRPFELDVAAEPETTKCAQLYVSPDWFERSREQGAFLLNANAKVRGFDALQCDWAPHWWCNPPFDKKPEFISKAAAEAKKGNPGMMLLPYEPLTGWWLEYVEGKAAAIYEADGRYNFVEPDGVTKKTGVNFGSVFVLFTPGYFPVTQRIRFKRGISDELTINFREKVEFAA